MAYSNHHTTPLSLWWIDKDFNIIRLEQRDHDIIHKTCDISYKLYHLLNRKIKMKMNWHMLIPESALKIQHEMQNRFYEWYDYLPERLQKLIDKVRSDTLDHRNDKLKLVTNDQYDISHETHKQWLAKEHEIQLLIQKELLQALKKQFNI